jgi:hypothetical protein
MGQLERVPAADQVGRLTRWWLAVLLALVSSTGTAQDAGALLDAPPCRRALQELEAREAAAAQERNAAKAALEAARRQAATACLGGRDSAASAPPRAAQPAATLGAPPGAATTIAPPRRPGVTAVPPAPPRPAAPPVTVTACDPSGCWASDGSRLQRVGPNLLGPTGFCTTSGNQLHCPR